MDKIWMSMSRLSQHYADGVEAFLNFAFQNACGANALTHALDKPEHSGRVRGLGAYVTPTTFFNCPRERREKTANKPLLGLEDAKKRIELQDAHIHDQDTRIHDQDTRMRYQDKVIYELLDRIGKLENAQGAKDKLTEEKGSCSVKLSRHMKDGDDDDVILAEKSATCQGKTVTLTLGPTKIIVGYGTVVAAGDKLHGAPMPKDCLRVSIDEVVDENAPLPFPISDEIYTVGTALATHVTWPTHLVVVNDETPAKRKVETKLVKVKCLASLPSSLKALYCMMDRSFSGRGIRISLDVDVFGYDVGIWIMLEDDVIPFCDLEPITGNCIVSYVWHLYKNMKKDEMKHRFLFVNPFGVSHAPNVSRDDRARKLADRLLDATSNQLALVPCNVGGHWILTIIQPHKGCVYLMDPLSHRNRDGSWKSMVDTAMSIFNANKVKKFKKPPSWEIIKSPIQPDSKQCGYYVMWFMKEIVKEFQNDDFISLTTLFQKCQYSEGEINEVREDWANCVIDESLC